MCIGNCVVKAGLGAILLGSVLALTTLAGSGPAASGEQADKPQMKPATGSPQPAAKSLFDRLGGTYGIAAMVDDYVDNLVKDPVVMANPQTKASVARAAAAHGVPGLKYQITAMVIEGCGGPYKYHGRNMKETHKTLNINQSEWDAADKVFRTTLAKFNVAQKEQDEVFAFINSFHNDIVVNGTGGGGMEKPKR